MEIRITIGVVAAALALSSQAWAQQTFQPAAWQRPSANAQLFTGYPVSSSYRTVLAGHSLDVGTQAPAKRDFLQIAGSFKTQSQAATLTKQWVYATSPFWLRHSRPFPSDSRISAPPEVGVLNQIAATLKK